VHHPGHALVPWVLAPGASAAALSSAASTSSTYSPGRTRVRLGPGTQGLGQCPSRVRQTGQSATVEVSRRDPAPPPYARARGSDM